MRDMSITGVFICAPDSGALPLRGKILYNRETTQWNQQLSNTYTYYWQTRWKDKYNINKNSKCVAPIKRAEAEGAVYREKLQGGDGNKVVRWHVGWLAGQRIITRSMARGRNSDGKGSPRKECGEYVSSSATLHASIKSVGLERFCIKTKWNFFRWDIPLV